MSHPWYLPKDFMQTADVLGPAPAWGTDTGTDLIIDIVPFSANRVDYGTMPQVTMAPFTHRGYCDALGPISPRSPDRYRLKQGTRQFKIIRVKDWDGFYELDLDEVQGG
jgi:hypothetical protein